ncbi:uncharacterized protein [Periplaneta americana]
MAFYKIIYFFGLLFLRCRATTLESSDVSTNDINLSSSTPFEDCLKKDSISCVQIQIYRSLKSFFDRDIVDLTGGLSFVRERDSKNQAKPRTTEDVLEDDQVLRATDVEKRESALESFVFQKVMAFFQERSIRWNLAPAFSEMTTTARGIVNNIPEDFRQKVADLVTEGRGKKRILKTLLPILIGVKVKAVAVMVLAYFGIALIAKKALLLSLISLAISAFSMMRKFLSQRSHHPHHEVHESYASPHSWGGYSMGYDSSGYGHGEYGSHSSQVAHTMAYGSQKAARRR